MTAPGRTLVTFAVDAEMHRHLTNAATAANRSIAEEIETRLIAIRVIEESMRILKTMRSRDETIREESTA